MPSTVAPPPYDATTPPPSRPGWPAGRRSPGSSGPTSRTWPSCRSRSSATRSTGRAWSATAAATGCRCGCSCASTGTTSGPSPRSTGSASCRRGTAGTGCCSPRSPTPRGSAVTTCSSSPGTGARSRSAPRPGCWASSTRTAWTTRPTCWPRWRPASTWWPPRCPTAGRARWCSTRCRTRRTSTGCRACPVTRRAWTGSPSRCPAAHPDGRRRPASCSARRCSGTRARRATGWCATS